MVTWDEDDEPATKQLLVRVAARHEVATPDFEEAERSKVLLVVKWCIIVIPAILVFTILKGAVVGMISGVAFGR
jgi:hypothetical protein